MNLSIKIDSYSAALESLCEKNNKLLNDLIKINKIFCEYKQLITILNSYNISKNNKNNIIDKIFTSNNEFELLTINFLKVLISNNHFFLVLDVLKNVFKKINKKKNIAEVKIETVYELSKNNLDEIVNWLSKKLNKTIVFQQEINKELIGGIKIIHDSTCIDFSIEGKINSIKNKLIERIKEDEFVR